MMEAKQNANQGETLASALEGNGMKAFNPAADAQSRAEGQKDFGALISRTGTSALMSALNALIKPDRVPEWLRVRLIDILTLLPQRPDGVRATLEFVFSVHPSSTVRLSEAATPQKQGANITMEALKMASTLLAVPPASVKPEAWFPGIAPQLFTLLDGDNGSDLAKVAAYVVGFGVLGRKQFGAPGTPGWKAFAEPMLACINPSLSSKEGTAEPLVFSAGPDQVVNIWERTIIVQADALHLALKRLASLLNSHPNPGLTKRLLSPLLIPLWALSSWPSAPANIRERYCQPAKDLIDVYLKLAGSADKFLEIIKNLLSSGSLISPGLQWTYEQVSETRIQVRRLYDDESTTHKELNLEIMDLKVEAFIELLHRTASDTHLSSLFLGLFETSFAPKKHEKVIQIMADDDDSDPISQLLQARILQGMMERFPDKLISNSKQLLELVSKVLGEFGMDSANDDAVPVALSLLNLVVTVPSFQRKDVPETTLTSIEISLSKISMAREADVSQTAHNLSQLLRYRDELEDPADRPTAPTDRQIEDKKTYNLALSYITQVDSPPPVRSEGLNLLGTLIKANSAIVDIPATLVLLSSILSDDDEYISLRVMKVFVQLSERHPRSTIREVLDQYVDGPERLNTDTRLRFGEALLQLMQRLGETFAGEIASSVGEALLGLAGRRAHRPKTEEQQARAEQIAARKSRAKAKLGKAPLGRLPPDDEDEDMDLDLEEQTPEERTHNAVLARIVSGWESKRGSEDMRIRASALSLFASGLETNIRAFAPPLIDAALGLSLDVLTLEAGMLEAGILRRAAVTVLLRFVYALGEARTQGKHLDLGSGLRSNRNGVGSSFGTGFTVKEEDMVRVLGYVEQTDEDGLVRQHAQDALESLENLKMVQLIPPRQQGQDTMSPALKVAALDMSRPDLPVLSANDGTHARPRIEEIT
ncbi:hypothetical protein F4777DRAFT_551504 [Nemania sp. FL0916]|nr:hypothetical protein F4777DRAFT_551504 [Nemania sp. FL0916]